MAIIVLTPQQVEELHSPGNQTFNLIFNTLYTELRFFMKYNYKCDEEDLVVNAFLKFWERRTRFNTFDEIRAFLYKTTTNAYYDLLRHQQVKDNHKQYVISRFNDLDEYHMFQQHMLQLEYIQLIYAEIENLPDYLKRIFKLTYIDCLTNSEIANVLDISIDSVKAMKSRALNKLRATLSDKKLFLAAALIVIIGIKIFSKNSLLLTGQDVLLTKRSSEQKHLPVQHRDNNKHNH